MKILVRLGMVVIAASMFVGCQSNRQITRDGVRADMAPELETIASTQQQRKNMVARSLDTNFRQLNDDWDRFWLLDEPLHLSKYPIP